MDPADHDVYFHALQDLVRRYRDEDDAGRRRQIRTVIQSMIDNADALGLTLDELGGIRSACCAEFLDLSAGVLDR